VATGIFFGGWKGLKKCNASTSAAYNHYEPSDFLGCHMVQFLALIKQWSIYKASATVGQSFRAFCQFWTNLLLKSLPCLLTLRKITHLLIDCFPIRISMCSGCSSARLLGGKSNDESYLSHAKQHRLLWTDACPLLWSYLGGRIIHRDSWIGRHMVFSSLGGSTAIQMM